MTAIKSLWKKGFKEIGCWKHEKRELGMGIGFGIVICWLFYDRIWLSGFLWPCLVPWMRYQRRKRKEREKEKMRKDFREMMQLVSNGLSVGYSLENALKSACHDMKQNQGKESGRFLEELEIVTASMYMHEPADQLLLSMAEKLDLEELRQFAEIVLIVRRSGGNLIEIIQRTCGHLGQSLQIKEEIRTMTAAKQMEKKVMSFMPYFILVYIRTANPGYFQVLYETIPGIVLSTFALISLISAQFWAERMVVIEI